MTMLYWALAVRRGFQELSPMKNQAISVLGFRSQVSIEISQLCPSGVKADMDG